MPTVTWVEGGTFYTVGYFYDKTGTLTSNAVVSVDIHGNGLFAIRPVQDISALLRRVRHYKMGQWLNAQEAYFAGPLGNGKYQLNAYIDSQKIPLDVGVRYDGIAAGHNRVIYAIRRNATTGGVVICEPLSRKKWKVGEPDKTYNYLYMSLDGRTALVSFFDLYRETLTTWYAREDDGYKLHGVPGIDAVPPGVIRLSPNGDAVVFFNKDGLRVIRLPGT